MNKWEKHPRNQSKVNRILKGHILGNSGIFPKQRKTSQIYVYIREGPVAKQEKTK